MGNYVKNYYKMGLYTADNLKLFVSVAYITAADFKELTGTDYVA